MSKHEQITEALEVLASYKVNSLMTPGECRAMEVIKKAAAERAEKGHEFLDTMLDILRANHRTMKSVVNTLDTQTQMLTRILEILTEEGTS